MRHSDRRWTFGPAALRLAAALLCLITFAPAAVLAQLDAAAAGRMPQGLAEGVHVLVGDVDAPTPANRGEIGNIGFVVGEQGTVVINCGASYRHGRAVIETAERIGGKPVVLAIITQPLQEFVMGASAFAERGIPVLSHRASAELIEARCETCLRTLRTQLGEDEMAGTRVVVPTQRIDGDTVVTVGGRELQLIHPGWGSSPGDLIVRDTHSGIVFAGALAGFGRVPELRDGDMAGWLAALDRLEALAGQGRDLVVPGYGAPAGTHALAALRHYLRDIDTRVHALLAAGTPLLEAIKAADLPAYSHWARYPLQHERNVQRRYLALENELFED
ncbi:hypothetical protein B447_18959 [Thauera sp. 27]|uniref:MBL fold metallo-hydrolase n=1 Tax=Thauera sp. 27 TaxID=305700 RepID=UPI0002D12DF8|nr:MBL fold metallo-hydrolase [Thauera sp. 27]ENO75803.1 hypothetical protein B447_18959 [Thauera sp. 27]